MTVPFYFCQFLIGGEHKAHTHKNGQSFNHTIMATIFFLKNLSLQIPQLQRQKEFLVSSVKHFSQKLRGILQSLGRKSVVYKASGWLQMNGNTWQAQSFQDGLRLRLCSRKSAFLKKICFLSHAFKKKKKKKKNWHEVHLLQYSVKAFKTELCQSDNSGVKDFF